MAIVSFLRLKADKASTKINGNKIERSFTQTYQAISNTIADTGDVVLAYVNTQIALGTVLISGVYLQDISVSQTDELRWEVVFSYSSNCPDPEQAKENPLLRAPVWSFDFEKVKEAIQKDLEDKPLLNSASDPFLPPVEIDITHMKMKVEVNLATVNFNAMTELVDNINHAPWKGFPAYAVKFEPPTMTQQFENGIFFYKVVYNFTCRKKYVYNEETLQYEWQGGWYPVRVLDQGYYTRDYAGRRKQIRDSLGQAKSTPTLLNGSGAELPQGDEPYYQEFKMYEFANFSLLPI